MTVNMIQSNRLDAVRHFLPMNICFLPVNTIFRWPRSAQGPSSTPKTAAGRA